MTFFCFLLGLYAGFVDNLGFHLLGFAEHVGLLSASLCKLLVGSFACVVKLLLALCIFDAFVNEVGTLFDGRMMTGQPHFQRMKNRIAKATNIQIINPRSGVNSSMSYDLFLVGCLWDGSDLR